MGSEMELRLRPEQVAPSMARAAIAAVASRLPAAVVADAELLTSEVVTNAVRHAELDPSHVIVVRIVADGYVRVDVGEPGTSFLADLRMLGPDSSSWASSWSA